MDTKDEQRGNKPRRDIAHGKRKADHPAQRSRANRGYTTTLPSIIAKVSRAAVGWVGERDSTNKTYNNYSFLLSNMRNLDQPTEMIEIFTGTGGLVLLSIES